MHKRFKLTNIEDKYKILEESGDMEYQNLKETIRILADVFTIISVIFALSSPILLALKIYTYETIGILIVFLIIINMVIHFYTTYQKQKILDSLWENATISVNEIMKSQLPGMPSITVRDILRDNLYLDIPWRYLNSNTNAHMEGSLVDTIRKGIAEGNKFIVLGEPGSGKSILLAKVFSELVNEKNNKFVPIFVDIKLLSHYFETYNKNSILDLISHYINLTTTLNISSIEISNVLRNLVFIFDGLDEATPKMLEYLVNEISVLDSPFVISCRKKEYLYYVQNSKLDNVSTKIELLPLTLNEIKLFSKKYFRKLIKHDSLFMLTVDFLTRDFLTMITADETIFEVVKYPLMLSMTIQLYLNNSLSPDGNRWDLYKLYSQYVHTMLSYETNNKQSNSIISLELKQMILTKLAGYMFLQQRRYASLVEINKLMQELGIVSEIKIIHHELCYHSLLSYQKLGECSFIHMSFQDYYTAEYIIQILKYGDITTGTRLLKLHIPSNIERFLKYGLKSLENSEMVLVANSLRRIYKQLENEQTDKDDESIIMGKQQSAHYLTILIPYLPPTYRSQVEKFIFSVLKREKNKFITRGIRVALFRHANKREVLREYLEILETDPEDKSVNCGYYLLYYGDQSESYIDKGQEHCENTIKNILRHLKSPDHKTGWPLDLITLRQCIIQHKDRRRYFISSGYAKEFLSTIQSNIREYLNDDLTLEQLMSLINQLKLYYRELDDGTIKKLKTIMGALEYGDQSK